MDGACSSLPPHVTHLSRAELTDWGSTAPRPQVLLGLGKRIGKDTYDHIGSEVSFEEREPAIKECSKVLLRLPGACSIMRQ